MSRVVAVVQARMGSTRLPGKVLAPIGGSSMLGQVVRRVSRARRVDEIVIATSTGADDDAVAGAAGRLGAAVHRGPAADVLERYAGAARAYRAGVVVRVTADCPLLDPGVVDQVIEQLTPEIDYASNTHARRFPRGLDVEALHADTLARIARLGTSPAAREHVTAFVMEQPALFRIAQLDAEHDDSDLRWTVDTADDLQMVRGLYDALSLDTAPLAYREVVAAVRARPELCAGNAHVIQKPWQEPHVA